jgi:hypothetical protein
MQRRRLTRGGHGTVVDEMQRWPPFIAAYCIEVTWAYVRRERGRSRFSAAVEQVVVHARGEMGQLGAAQRRSTHTCCRPQRGRRRQRPRVRATLGGLCLYAAVQAELARVLDTKATRGEKRRTSAPYLCGYSRSKEAR